MTYALLIKEEATWDIAVAFDYYEEQQNGLGDAFLQKLKALILYINQYPLHFNKVEKEFRQALISKFPYVIIYELSGSEIIIYAVFHCSQNPDKKFKG